MAEIGQRPKKLCFVTIGATASFDSLISACLEPRFLEALAGAGYTHLVVQYGKEGKSLYDRAVSESVRTKELGVSVTGFDFNRNGLGQEMRAAKGEAGGVEGVVISHAGKLYQAG